MSVDRTPGDAAPPNPLVGPLLAILRRFPAGLSEYQIFEALAEHWPPLADDARLALFQKHFLVMNGLYRLQTTLWAEARLHVSISPLLVRIETVDESGAGAALARADAPLRDYYLDWSQLGATDRAAVDGLLHSFWQRFYATDAVDDAFAVLGVAVNAEWPAVQRGYRRRAAETHPDRGGAAEEFLAVRAAYETLRHHFGRQRE